MALQENVVQFTASQAFTAAVSILGFLVIHLASAIWFASKMNTRVGQLTRTLENLEKDMKSLVKFDTKIEVLHERMNQSQQDRGQLWVAVNDLRRTMSSIQLRQTKFDDERLS